MASPESGDSAQSGGAPDWVPSICRLPSADQPLRVAEFDALFSSALRDVRRLGPTRLRLILDVEEADRAKELTARETECCSFFAFAHRLSTDWLTLDVELSPAHVEVLDGLERRAWSHVPAQARP